MEAINARMARFIISRRKNTNKQKQSEATVKQIFEKGHPAAGRIVSQEERELHRKIRLDNPIEYTKELRQKCLRLILESKIPKKSRPKKICKC